MNFVLTHWHMPEKVVAELPNRTGKSILSLVYHPDDEADMIDRGVKASICTTRKTGPATVFVMDIPVKDCLTMASVLEGKSIFGEAVLDGQMDAWTIAYTPTSITASHEDRWDKPRKRTIGIFHFERTIALQMAQTIREVLVIH